MKCPKDHEMYMHGFCETCHDEKLEKDYIRRMKVKKDENKIR